MCQLVLNVVLINFIFKLVMRSKFIYIQRKIFLVLHFSDGSSRSVHLFKIANVKLDPKIYCFKESDYKELFTIILN
jgi:hypothetical protein